jgi:hypothetical protein
MLRQEAALGLQSGFRTSRHRQQARLQGCPALSAFRVYSIHPSSLQGGRCHSCRAPPQGCCGPVARAGKRSRVGLGLLLPLASRRRHEPAQLPYHARRAGRPERLAVPGGRCGGSDIAAAGSQKNSGCAALAELPADSCVPLPGALSPAPLSRVSCLLLACKLAACRVSATFPHLRRSWGRLRWQRASACMPPLGCVPCSACYGTKRAGSGGT